MQQRQRWAAMLAAVCVLGAVFTGAQAPGETILWNANVIDGESDAAYRATVTVREGRIARIERNPQGAPPAASAAVQVINAEKYWLLPGYVDAHVHISTLEDARRALRSGATTVRSMGVNHFVDVGMRELHRKGALDLPETLAAGYHVRTTPAEAYFLDFVEPLRSDAQRSTPMDPRAMVRNMLSRRVDWIKVNATERAGLVQDDPRKRMWSDSELKWIVEEAAKERTPVAAHAHGDEGARGAVLAGVATIEHGTYLSEATLREMKARGTCLVPTVATIVDMSNPVGEDSNAQLAVRGRAMVPRLRETVAMAWKLGVKMAGGTDTGYTREATLRMPVEIAELTASGLPAMAAIQAGTRHSAECLGIGARTGSIREGKEADLILVERNPLADVTALQEVLLVMNNGAVVVNRLAP